MGADKMVVSKDILIKIKSRAQTIKSLCKDKVLVKEADEILDLISKELNKDTETVLEKIEKKMKETRNVNPDLNANLYILRRNLMKNKITEEDALALYTMYLESEVFDKKIY
ncbi:hypothetical protein [Clostridium sp. BSD9I1]|uniref:hypothetical protein n=1 Tax=Clostridium sp. BSD9I1 TaxID=2003589 RepID=UPI0016454722|nr:hypothetical protein [Clostridium sp. BSD9I1]